jgi:hypothetical protein
MLLNIFFLILNITFIYSYDALYTGSFLKKYKIYSEINNLLKTNNNTPLILNGEKNLLKRDFCKYMCTINNFNFKEYTFNNFILNSPYLSEESTLLYVNDFMVGNGRILNHFEEDKILNLPHTNNIIILQSDNIENIPFKDNNIIKRYNILEFPKITKKDVVHYIHDMIHLCNYNNDMYILNWNSYDIENFNFEYLNMLLFQINFMLDHNTGIKEIHKNMNFIIQEFKN